jgi:phage regulator Rha-like protein
MKNLINTNHPLQIEGKIIEIRNQNVILDSDVAEIYGVQTKEITQAIMRNPQKFPDGYVFQLRANEMYELQQNNQFAISQLTDNQDAVTNCDHILKTSQLQTKSKSTTLPKAFTEKGLYMLATILKSDRATEATIEIIETFAKLKQLQANIAALNTIDPEVVEVEVVEKTVEKTGTLLEELLFTATPTSAKTSMEVNLGLIKLKREIISEKNPPQSTNCEFEELKKMIDTMSKQLASLSSQAQ